MIPAVLLCAYALLIVCSTIGSGSGKTASSFFVNSRSSGALEVAFSIIVSCIGASATVGMIGLGFTAGTPAFWWLGSGAIGLTLLSLLLARRVRESGVYTMPQLVESYLGGPARPAISLVIVTAWTAILAAQFTALVNILGGMTGFSSAICMLVAFAFIVLHSLGGQRAIIRLDRYQALILFAALGLLLFQLTKYNPSWMEGVSLEAVNVDFPPEKLIYFLLVVGANYLICPMLFGRLLSAGNGKSARAGGLLAAGGIAVCAVLIVCVGLACRGILPAETAQDAVLMSALAEAFPDWMRLAISLGLVSAIVSSADSCLITAATVLSHDLLGRTEPGSGRLAVFGLGVTGMAFSLWGKGIMAFLLMAYDIYACGVVAPVFVGMLLNRKIEPRFACAAVGGGGILGLVSALSGYSVFSYAGILLATLVTLAGAHRASLLMPESR